MNVLLTGAEGYIGTHIGRALCDEGYKVIGIDPRPRRYADCRLHRYVQQRCSAKRLKNDLRHFACPISAIIHTGGIASVSDSIVNPAAYYENNVGELIQLLALTTALKIPAFIFSSSSSVYSNPMLDRATPEGDNTVPESPYGRTKLIGEQILRDYHNAYGLEVANLRYFSVCGAHPDGYLGEAREQEDHLIPLAIKAAQTNGNFTLYGDGSKKRDFIHVMDVVSANLLILKKIERGEKLNHTEFNIGKGESYSITQVLSRVREEIGAFNITHVGDKAGEPYSMRADIGRMKREVDWKPQYTLDDAIKHTDKWLRKYHNEK